MITIELVLFVRPGSGALKTTIDSLLTQTDKSFSVLISESSAAKARDVVSDAQTRLTAGGITVRAANPPPEYGAVEHLNWAILESDTAWIKPLLCGDQLEPRAIECVRRAIAASPEALFLDFGYDLQDGCGAAEPVAVNSEARFYGPREMRDFVLRGPGLQSLSAVAFRRDALAPMGGIRPGAPSYGGRLLCGALASRFGAVRIPSILGHFPRHQADSSFDSPHRPPASLREMITYLGMLAYHDWTEGNRVSFVSLIRMMTRELRVYYRDTKSARGASQ